MPLQLSSAAFDDGDDIPSLFTCEGSNVPPPLAWSGAPEATQSFALVVDDPDAPNGPFVHWLLYDIPAGSAGIDQSSAVLGKTLANDFGKPGYGGPCPPRGHGPHRYRFTLHAVDVPSLSVAGVTRADLENALRPRTLATAGLTGRYERA